MRKPLLLGHVNHGAAQGHHLAPGLLDGGADIGGRFDHGLHHFRLDLVAHEHLRLAHHLLDVRLKIAGRGVDDLELFFHADREFVVGI